MFIFTIQLPPVSWQAPRLSRYQCYDPKEVEKRAIRYLIREQYEAIKPIEDFVCLSFRFTFKIPPSYSKKKRRMIEEGKLFPTRLDCTNMQKLYEDCLKGIVIKDDRQVISISSDKEFGERDEIKILVFSPYEEEAELCM